MDKYTPQVNMVNVVYHNNYVKEILFEGMKNVKRKDIKDYVKKLHNEFIRLGHKGSIQVALWYPDKQRWFYSAYKDFDDGIPYLYSFKDAYGIVNLDPETYSAVMIHITKTNSESKGGNDPNNDCLYNCLLLLIPDLKNIWVNGFYFKKYLGIERNDKVDIDKIKLIEDALKDYKINVYGEHKYISTKKAKYELFLNLSNEHYTVDKTKMWKVSRIATQEKEPLVFKYSKKDRTKVLIYGRTRETNWKVGLCVWDYDYFIKEKNFYFSSLYCFINIDKNKKMSMKNKYIEFIKNANELKEATNGRINLQSKK